MTDKQGHRRQLLLSTLSLVQPIRDDLHAFAQVTSVEVDRFKREEIGTEEMFFWQKSLARSFFAFADVLGSILCRAVIERAAELGLKLSRTKQKELARSRSATMKRLSLGFSLFPLLFESDFRVEPSAIEMRALEVLSESRISFVHPKEPKDIFPAGLLVAAKPAMEWLVASWALSALRNACRGDGVLSKACAFRNLVRTFMSEVEGSVFTLAYHLSVRNGTDPPGRELLSGKDEEVRDRIALTLESFSRGIGEVMAVERGGSGWESFAQARRLRDRFEHPGGPESFEWNETELDELMKALTWWHAQVDGCLELDPEKYARWATQ